MKLIIDIPKEKYEMFLNDGYAGLLDNDLYYDIKNGTPIPDNATNGELFESIFEGSIAYAMNNEIAVDDVCEMARALRLGTPLQEPKTGHWILTSDDDYEYCTCSECGYQNGENWMIGSQIKYCQECGARMIKPQERSNKE